MSCKGYKHYTTLINWYTIVGNPKDILKNYSYVLTKAVAGTICSVTSALHARELIPPDTKELIHTATGISNNNKSSQLVLTIEQQLEASLTPDQYLIDICHVLINQQHQTLTDIATNILHQLGE